MADESFLSSYECEQHMPVMRIDFSAKPLSMDEITNTRRTVEDFFARITRITSRWRTFLLLAVLVAFGWLVLDSGLSVQAKFQAGLCLALVFVSLPLVFSFLLEVSLKRALVRSIAFVPFAGRKIRYDEWLLSSPAATVEGVINDLSFTPDGDWFPNSIAQLSAELDADALRYCRLVCEMGRPFTAQERAGIRLAVDRRAQENKKRDEAEALIEARRQGCLMLQEKAV